MSTRFSLVSFIQASWSNLLCHLLLNLILDQKD